MDADGGPNQAESIVNSSDPHPGFLSRHRFVWLFAALLAFFVVVPIVHQIGHALHPTTGPFVEGLVFIAVLAGVVVSVSTRQASRLFALGFAFPLGVLAVLHAFHKWEGFAITRDLLGTAFLGYAIVVMLRFILTSREVTFNTVCASLCIYLLLGVVWALLYSLIDHLDPAAFYSATNDGRSAPVLRIGSGESTAVLYFSFCTLTTLGYGDIVPVTPVARTLASLEAITGQLYLAVLVARLVGLHIAASLEQK